MKVFCELDKMPFAIDILESEVEELVLKTFEGAHEKVLELKFKR